MRPRSIPCTKIGRFLNGSRKAQNDNTRGELKSTLRARILKGEWGKGACGTMLYISSTRKERYTLWKQTIRNKGSEENNFSPSIINDGARPGV